MSDARPPTPERQEYRLNPVVQGRLLEQRRQEMAAAQRSKVIQLYVLLPGLLVAFVFSAFLAVSDDMTEMMIGQTVASVILFGVWAVRKRIAAMFQ